VLPGLGDVRVSARLGARARTCWTPPLPGVRLLSPGSGSGADPSPSLAREQLVQSGSFSGHCSHS
jgi:hypothetical protein